MATAPLSQPKFDSRIQTLYFPLNGGQFGTIKRGMMVWEQAIAGYSSPAEMHFLYNPSDVAIQYGFTDPSVQAAVLFPSSFDNTQLRTPLNQQASWSLLFDRTYEVWGNYDSTGQPTGNIGSGQNNPQVVGVLADIIQMQQFTGMKVDYSTGNGSTTSPGQVTTLSQYHGQGVLQQIPSYVYFGDANNLWLYGYVSEWDVTVTHWTQYMVPVRCEMNISFTLLPGTQQAATSSYKAPLSVQGVNPSALPAPPNYTYIPQPGVSGR